MFKFRRNTKVVVSSKEGTKTAEISTEVKALDEHMFEELDELTRKYYNNINELLDKFNM